MDSNLHFLGLSETWLHNGIQTDLIDIPGYKCFRNDRKSGRGGGVALYVRDNMICTEVTFDHELNIEYICVEISLAASMHFKIVIVYNPPSFKDAFYNEWSKLLKSVAHKSEVIVLGDFNIDWSPCQKEKT